MDLKEVGTEDRLALMASTQNLISQGVDAGVAALKTASDFYGGNEETESPLSLIQNKKPTQEKGTVAERQRIFDESKGLFSTLKDLGMEDLEKFKKNPVGTDIDFAKKLSSRGPMALGGGIIKGLQDQGTSFLNPSNFLEEKMSSLTGKTSSPTLGEMVMSAAKQGLTEEEIGALDLDKAQLIGELGSGFGLGGVGGITGGASKAAQKIAPKLTKAATQAAAKAPKAVEMLSPQALKQMSPAQRKESVAAIDKILGKKGSQNAQVVKVVYESPKIKEPTPLKGRTTKGATSEVEKARVEKATAGKAHKTQGEIELREAQLKAEPRFSEQIAADIEKQGMNAEAKVPKTEQGRASQEARKKAAQDTLKEVEGVYKDAISRVRSLENEAAKATGKDKERIKALIGKAERDLKEASDALTQTMITAETGVTRQNVEGLKTAARNKIDKIRDASHSNEPFKFTGHDYSKDTIDKAKALRKKKIKPPAREAEDMHNKANRIYQQEYDKELKNIAKQLKTEKNPGNVQALRKQQETIKNLRDHTQAKIDIHNHELALRDIKARKDIADKLKKTTKAAPSKTSEKVDSISRKYGLNPSKENLTEISKATGIPEKEISTAHTHIEKEIQGAKKNIIDTIRGKGSPQTTTGTSSSSIPKKPWGAAKTEQIVNEFKEIGKNLSNRQWSKAFLSKPGLTVAVNLLDVATEEILGFKLPWQAKAIVSGGMLISMGGSSRIITAAIQGAHLGSKKVRSESKINKYKDSILHDSPKKQQMLKATLDISASQLKKSRERADKERRKQKSRVG
ncbi:MAG TPA: hypothetical protein VMW91_00600 [Desulfosporosinus sp.]|nr:hypothetical protein [Desulfosporosinus sp.]